MTKLASRTIGPSRSSRLSVDGMRDVLARTSRLVCLVAALVLAVGALLVVLDANRDNVLVRAVLDLATVIDLDVFSRTNGIKQFTGEHAVATNALFNWGLGAAAWLVAGRLAVRLIGP